jgi:hypothetical protein
MSMHSRLEHLEQIARLVAAERHAESAISDHDEAESELSRAAERIETTAKELQEAKLRHLHETKLRGFANGQAKWEEEVARVEPIYRAMCASPEWERLCGIAEDLGRGPFRLKMAVAQRGRETICLPFETNGERGDAWLPDDLMIDREVEWSVTEPFTLIRRVRCGPLGRSSGRWEIANIATFADLAGAIPVVPVTFKAHGGGNPASVLPFMARYFVDLVAREELIPFLVEKLSPELMQIEAELLDEL